MTRSHETFKDAPQGDSLVFSDLDGSLLDHDGYSFEAAKPALAELAERGISIVPSTSKTLAELESLAPALGFSAAAIAENGAAIRFADGTIDRAIGRDEIAAILDTLPPAMRGAMQCFCDMQSNEIAQLTGLDAQAAAQAATREASEPFLWQGDAAGLTALSAALAAHDLCVTQGGRFFHIVPPRDKAAAMEIMLAQQARRVESWALGDGPNDVSMLLAADRAALISNRHLDTQRLLPSGHQLYLTKREGSAGWREAIAVFLSA